MAPNKKIIKITRKPDTRFVIAFKAHEYLNVKSTHVYKAAAEEKAVYIRKDNKFHKVGGATINVVDFKSIDK